MGSEAQFWGCGFQMASNVDFSSSNHALSGKVESGIEGPPSPPKQSIEDEDMGLMEWKETAGP